jgi:hypothetical protein
MTIGANVRFGSFFDLFVTAKAAADLYSQQLFVKINLVNHLAG